MDTSMVLTPENSTIHNGGITAVQGSTAALNSVDPLASDPNDPRVIAMTERAEAYGRTLRPKDCVILVEEIRVHMAKTRYMKAFMSEYLNPILEHLNGGPGLKVEFGCDEYTSLYTVSLFDHVKKNSMRTVDIPSPPMYNLKRSTPMISRVVDTFKKRFKDFKPYWSEDKTVSARFLLKAANYRFSKIDSYRKNKCSSDRFLILVLLTNLDMTGVEEEAENLKKLPVSLSIFSIKHCPEYAKLYELVNGYSCDPTQASHELWPVAYISGIDLSVVKPNKQPQPATHAHPQPPQMPLTQQPTISEAGGHTMQAGTITAIGVPPGNAMQQQQQPPQQQPQQQSQQQPQVTSVTHQLVQQPLVSQSQQLQPQNQAPQQSQPPQQQVQSQQQQPQQQPPPQQQNFAPTMIQTQQGSHQVTVVPGPTSNVTLQPRFRPLAPQNSMSASVVHSHQVQQPQQQSQQQPSQPQHMEPQTVIAVTSTGNMLRPIAASSQQPPRILPSTYTRPVVRFPNMAQQPTVVPGTNIVLQPQPQQQQAQNQVQVQVSNAPAGPVLWEGRVTFQAFRDREPMHMRIYPHAPDSASIAQAQTLNFSSWNDAVSLVILKSECKALIQDHLTKSKYKSSLHRVAIDMGRREDSEFMKSIVNPPSGSNNSQQSGGINFGLIHVNQRPTAERGHIVTAMLIMYHHKREVFIGIVPPDQQKFLIDITNYLRRSQSGQMVTGPQATHQMLTTVPGPSYAARPTGYQQPQVMMQTTGPTYTQQTTGPTAQAQQATRQVVISQQPGQQHIIRQQYTPVTAQQQQQQQQPQQQQLRTVPISTRYHPVLQTTAGPQPQARFASMVYQTAPPDQQPNDFPPPQY